MRSARTVVSLVGIWFVTALVTAWAGVFDGPGPPLALAAAVTGPPLAVLALLARSSMFRAWARSLDPRLLVTFQMWRILGFSILVAWGVGVLPGGFAVPAGFGDVVVALLAPVVVWALGRPHGRVVFRIWTALGIGDLLVAAALGVLYGPRIGVLAEGTTLAAMGVLPLAVIPAFAVPLFLSIHLISLYTVRFIAETDRHDAPGAQPIPPQAATGTSPPRPC